MTRAEYALSIFRQPPRHLNCAQTVCAAMGREDLVDAMKNCNVGKAPGGTCGALYAAITICPDRKETLCSAFSETLGATTCMQLKATHGVPCPRCVATAIRALC